MPFFNSDFHGDCQRSNRNADLVEKVECRALDTEACRCWNQIWSVALIGWWIWFVLSIPSSGRQCKLIDNENTLSLGRNTSCSHAVSTHGPLQSILQNADAPMLNSGCVSTISKNLYPPDTVLLPWFIQTLYSPYLRHGTSAQTIEIHQSSPANLSKTEAILLQTYVTRPQYLVQFLRYNAERVIGSSHQECSHQDIYCSSRDTALCSMVST